MKTFTNEKWSAATCCVGNVHDGSKSKTFVKSVSSLKLKTFCNYST